MASVKVNIIANIIGRFWAAAITILLIPQYIKYLGIESYGLVGFYATLIGTMSVLDMGLSTTLSRELAKQKAGNRSPKDIRDLTFSLELIYWGIGLLICLIIVLASGFITEYWVNAEQLPATTIRNTVTLMGLVILFQWPINLYDGGLRGLEELVLSNTITVIMATLRGAGVIVILKYVSPTLEAFFLWQAALSFMYVFIMRWGLWKKMPFFNQRPKFSRPEVRSIWRFALGMTGISAITFFLAQIDKVVLSKMLLLSDFGYYNLAFTIAFSITLIVGPVALAFFPRFATLVAAENKDELVRIYHKACRLMAAMVFPISFVLLFFIREILLIWTNNQVTTDNTYLMAQVLIIGSTLNALMVLPYQLIIAYGWTKFSFYQNVIAAVILVPMLFIWTNYYGAFGATFVWLSVNAGYVFISQPLMHRKLLKHELAEWYWHDSLLPMLPSLLMILFFKYSLPYLVPGFQVNLFTIICITLVTLTFSLLFMPDIRLLLRKMYSKLNLNGLRTK